MTDSTFPPPDRPLIRGERVWLRPLEERDLPAYVAGINDVEVGGWAGYRMPLSVPMASAWLARTLEQTRAGEGYYFAVCELGDDRFIGTTWLKEVSLVDGSAELAIFMDRDHLGGGWGTDAQRALIRFGFTTLRLGRIYLFVDDANVRAIRSYEKVGFVREGLLRRSRMFAGRLVDTVVMAVLRDEWTAPAG